MTRKNVEHDSADAKLSYPLAPRISGERAGERGSFSRHKKIDLNASSPSLREKEGEKKFQLLVSALLNWFSENARDLPWRRTSDPYAIWVSEIMLQQTQVKTVIPYWERWMNALPTIQALAIADSATIHKLWEGLGYYTRVRNLQKAAQQIVAQHGSRFPTSYEAILELPGIGRYTAGAISSIAFNEPRPILDGNVIRVVTRLFGITTDPREKTTNQELWQLAEQLVTTTARSKDSKTAACSHLNQSLMELGALICTPKQPKCLLCPVRKQCDAYRTGRIDEIPNLGVRAAATTREFIAFVVEHRGRYLARQRPAGQVNAHLWEFPNVEITKEDSDSIRTAQKELGLRLTNLTEFCTIKHSITRYRITLRAFLAKTNSNSPVPDSRWLTPTELDSLPFTSAHRKVLKRLLATKSN